MFKLLEKAQLLDSEETRATTRAVALIRGRLALKNWRSRIIKNKTTSEMSLSKVNRACTLG